MPRRYGHLACPTSTSSLTCCVRVALQDIGTAALLKVRPQFSEAVFTLTCETEQHTVEEDDDDDDAEDEGYLPKEKDESDEDDGQEWTPEPSPTIDDIVEDTGNLNLPVLKDNFKGPEQGATQVSDNGQSASNGAAGTKRSRDADDDAEDADAEDESEKKKVKA